MTPTLKVPEILEVALYVTDLAAAEHFYTKIMGLSLYSKVAERHVFLRCSDRMVLLFNAEATVNSGDGPLDAPEHGMKGAGHIAFAARDREIDQWKEYLTAQGVSIEKEICWERGRSIYFRDPSGNSVEITSPAIWGIEEDIFF
jgi:catechol 2,3-dioxygenase-like lactoylglutathione lyase family enzyme